MRAVDLTGQRYGRLVCVKRVENDHKGFTRWLCQCDCGNTHIVKTGDLRSGHVKSCGCITDERTYTHGRTHERLYRVWLLMKRRCYKKDYENYHYYGGRGIRVCDEWIHEYENFRSWAYANGYDESLPGYECTLDRIDVNGNYEPSNCRWVNMYVQANNTRRNRYITLNGETKTLIQWSRETGISRSAIHKRFKRGCTPEQALSPIRRRGWYKENGHCKKQPVQQAGEIVDADIEIHFE